MARGAPWPDEWTQMAREMWAQGASGGDVAKRLNAAFGAKLTRNAVLGKVDRLGLMKEVPKGEPSQTQIQGARLRRLKRAAPSPHTPRPKMPNRKTLIFKTAPAPRRPRIVPPAPPAPEGAPVDIFGLTAQSCRWPIDPAAPGEGWRYCGAERGETDPKDRYCDHHRWREQYG